MNMLKVSDSFETRDTASRGEINRPIAYILEHHLLIYISDKCVYNII